MPGPAPDTKEIRQAVLDTLARTGEPMLCRHIADYLMRRGWKGNMAARVSSHLTSLRAQGKVASMELPTGRVIPIHGRRFEERKRAWFLATMPIAKVQNMAIYLSKRGRQSVFRKPPEPYARTDDMRQMVDDLTINQQRNIQ